MVEVILSVLTWFSVYSTISLPLRVSRRVSLAFIQLRSSGTTPPDVRLTFSLSSVMSEFTSDWIGFGNSLIVWGGPGGSGHNPALDGVLNSDGGQHL